MNSESKILVIDDEQVIIDAVKKICAIDGYVTDEAHNVKAAMDKLEKKYYRIIVCDIMMPDGDGFQILDYLQKENIDSAVIMTTGYSTVENAVKSLYYGAIDFIPKPFTVDELLNSVFRADKYYLINKKQKELLSSNNNRVLLYVTCPSRYYRLGNSSWVVEERDGSALVGVCDLFVKIIESVKEIEFNEPEDEIVQGSNCVTITSGDDRIHNVLSPLTGRIIEVNEKLRSNPGLIEKDPYFKGWIYRVIPSDPDYEQKYLVPCSSDRMM